MNIEQSRLIDKKALGQLHPALAKAGRVEYLIRTRGIPIVRFGKLIFFDEPVIQKWIQENYLSLSRGLEKKRNTTKKGDVEHHEKQE